MNRLRRTAPERPVRRPTGGRVTLRVPAPRGAAPFQHVISHATHDVSDLRVVVLSDQLLTREALHVAIAAHGVAVVHAAVPHTAPDVQSVVERAHSFGADVGVVVLERFDPWQVRNCGHLVTRAPDLHWMVLTTCAPGAYWGALLAAGAEEVLPLDMSVASLLGALGALAEGHSVMDPALRALLGWRDVVARTMVQRLAHLSPREAEVLDHLAHGATVAQFAERHEVSAETVRSQVQAIFRKLQVTSQLAAVAHWTRATDEWPAAWHAPQGPGRSHPND